MTNKIADFYNSLNGKKVAFIGAGVTNKSCIQLFAKHGANITVCDKKNSISEFLDFADTLKELNVKLSLGENYLDGLAGQDIIMRTPGFEYYTKELQDALANGSDVTSEMELFFELCPCKTLAVTGSDGKTTTTSLIAHILECSGKKVHLGGNLGRALLPVAQDMCEDDWAVVELSSFQLISMRTSPDIAVVTNVTPNHLDHHKDMQEYIDAKRNILIYQNKNGRAILGYENETTKAMESDVKGELAWFTRLTEIENGAFLAQDGTLTYAHEGLNYPIAHKDDIILPGLHNVENVLAAIAATWGVADVEAIAEGVCSFSGVEHRIEFVREIDGVKFYNDSIATSPTRVVAGLRAFNQKLIIIAGGSDKKISFAPLVPHLFERVKTIILMGATAEKIEQAIKEDEGYKNCELKIEHAQSMEDAVKKARENAVEGDIISLSPACASFDTYINFEYRGRHFKDIVNEI